MAKVICALLRYTDDEKSLVMEHEKLRQSVRKIKFKYFLFSFNFNLALVKDIEIILIKVFVVQFVILFLMDIHSESLLSKTKSNIDFPLFYFNF